MSWSEIALIFVSIILFIVVISWIITSNKKKETKKEESQTEYEVINGVRYSKKDNIENNSIENEIELKKGDILLERGKEYKVGARCKILAGTYKIISGDENVDSINIRVGGIVRAFRNNSSIVLANGDKISAVSSNIVLR